MVDENIFFDYEKRPGLKQKNKFIKERIKPLVSIITSYYNSKEFLKQTVNSVINQTFPYWEWIIVDDGSTQKETYEILKSLEAKDSRIKVYHKQNEGLAKGRDYAIKYSTTKYILPLDADDLIDPTYIETLYFTLETNKEASFAFTNSVGFGKYIYLSNPDFDSERMKTDNHITATSLIRKEKIIELGGYGLAKRYVNEDWHLWLRMLAKGYYPVQVSFYGFWYRRRKTSLLSEINDEKKKENILRLHDLKAEADKITKKVNAKIYPQDDNTNIEYNKLDFTEDIKPIDNGDNVLYIIPWLKSDEKLFKKIKEESKNKNVIILTTKYLGYVNRQKLEQYSTIFDLTTFLDKKYWLGFIEYILNSRKVIKIVVDKTQDKKILNFVSNKNIETNFIEYKDDEKEHKRLIKRYNFNQSIIGRILRKIRRSFI